MRRGPSPRLRGEGGRRPDEGRHPAGILPSGAPHPALRATLSRQAGRGSSRSGGVPPPAFGARATLRSMNADLQLALSLADAADEITMRYFRNEFSVRTKADRTPVTEVDEAVERMIVDHLWQERPHDGILGEELGVRGGDTRRWIVDPIDATKNFIRGIPIFATLIALENELGVVSAPALGRRWWASRGDGAFCNGAPIHVSAVTDLGAAQIGYDDVVGFEQRDRGEQFLALMRKCGRARG